MARGKKHTAEQIVNLLRQVDPCAIGSTSARRSPFLHACGNVLPFATPT
jgi:hypothetical protein